MKLEDLGYHINLDKYIKQHKLEDFELGRVIAEHKERYIVKTLYGELDAEITGNLRYAASSREDFPAVGDWVAITTYDSAFGIIHHILPRFSVLKRQAVGQFGAIQIIATNVDYAFLVQAVDRDFNINRIERYLTICNEAKVKPIVILNKIDLIEKEILNEICINIKRRLSDVPIITISNQSKFGYDSLTKIIEAGKTYCLLGSSGVGKSTLLNNLLGKEIMRTDAISFVSNRGKHITSHRELIILDNGGIIIDNPGMREVGIADSDLGLKITFDKIIELSKHCKFSDCSHTIEVGCAVLNALDNGEIDMDTYENFLKIEKENTHFNTSLIEKKRKDKEFGKMLKNYKKDVKRNAIE